MMEMGENRIAAGWLSVMKKGERQRVGRGNLSLAAPTIKPQIQLLNPLFLSILIAEVANSQN